MGKGELELQWLIEMCKSEGGHNFKELYSVFHFLLGHLNNVVIFNRIFISCVGSHKEPFFLYE